MALKGDQGAKQVIMRYSHEVFCVSVPEGVIDVDTPKDYEQLYTVKEFR
jgi:molybdenum cofactor cytidylyltransferase